MRSHCRLRTASTSTLRRGAGQKWTTTRPKDRNEGMSGQYVEFFNDIGAKRPHLPLAGKPRPRMAEDRGWFRLRSRIEPYAEGGPPKHGNI